MLTKVDKTKLQTICRKWKIKELALFGSVLRDDFKPDSDVDVTVTFTEDAHWGLWEFYALRDELQALFGRDVDLVEPEGIINPIRKKRILNEKKVLYSAL